MAMLLSCSQDNKSQGANQEMESNLVVNGRELAVAFLGLLLFGTLYNLVVEHFQKRTQRYTAELVVIGVIVTLVASGFIIGWNDALVVAILFAASGIPMIAGSWIRSIRDDEAAKKIAKDSVQDLMK
jgi:uncharacterized membrane protein